MSLDEQKKQAIDKLLENRTKIEQIVYDIEAILQIYFKDEFDNAYQHWIPQIETALFNNTKWLPRGQFTMQDTISRILDSNQNTENNGVSKYI